tara:strand:+ start:1501 stop:2685 length:1185 start_codon:yes stop_codon:yes gene_type:complete
MAKNTHLEHLEDDIFNQGSAGATNAVNFLKSLRDMLTENSGGSAIKVTTKWDGAPAIVCGKNPQNGKFFVGTKSVFNKTDPKIVYTAADADRFYAGSTVALILKRCLEYLSTLPIDGVLQGDLLYQKALTKQTDDTYKFKPNTITYSVDADTPMGKKVGASKIGIVFHTHYTGNTMAELSAGFGVDVGSLQGVTNVAVFSSTFKNINGAANLSQADKARLNQLIASAERSLSQGSGFLNTIQGGKGAWTIPALFKVYFNQIIRGGRLPSNSAAMASGFKAFLSDRFSKEIAKKKTLKSKTQWTQKKADTIKYLNKSRNMMGYAFDGFKNLMDAKVLIINKLVTIKSVGTFLETENGLRATNPEGFVAIKDGAALKLVDRLEFSRANFTVAKDWG